MRGIRSYSDSDDVQVGVRFDWGRDVNLLRMEVKEKIDQIRGRLPADIRQIYLLTFDTNDIPVIVERAMYWSANGERRMDGHVSPGFRVASGVDRTSLLP